MFSVIYLDIENVAELAKCLSTTIYVALKVVYEKDIIDFTLRAGRQQHIY